MVDPRHSSLLQRLTRTRRVAREPEPADLGTAFGLDQTVDDTTWSPSLPPEPAARPVWWRRWAGRSAHR